jgi:hypothetical protein
MSLGTALFGIIILMFLAGLPLRARSKSAKAYLSYGARSLSIVLMSIYAEYIAVNI